MHNATGDVALTNISREQIISMILCAQYLLKAKSLRHSSAPIVFLNFGHFFQPHVLTVFKGSYIIKKSVVDKILKCSQTLAPTGIVQKLDMIACKKKKLLVLACLYVLEDHFYKPC